MWTWQSWCLLWCNIGVWFLGMGKNASKPIRVNPISVLSYCDRYRLLGLDKTATTLYSCILENSLIRKDLPVSKGLISKFMWICYHQQWLLSFFLMTVVVWAAVRLVILSRLAALCPQACCQAQDNLLGPQSPLEATQQSRYPINFPTSCNLSLVLYFPSAFGCLQLVWSDTSSGTIPSKECISCSWAGYSGWRAFFRLRHFYLPPLPQALLLSSKEVVWDNLSWELLWNVKADYEAFWKLGPCFGMFLDKSIYNAYLSMQRLLVQPKSLLLAALLSSLGH